MQTTVSNGTEITQQCQADGSWVIVQLSTVVTCRFTFCGDSDWPHKITPTYTPACGSKHDTRLI